MPGEPNDETCAVADIASFRPGIQNGLPYTLADVQGIADNFRLCTQTDPPWHLPVLSINHDDKLSFGEVTGAAVKMVGGQPTLVLDAAGVPVAVRDWMRRDRLRQPSVEFWDAGTFPMPDGSWNRTPVLKCLTLLGNDLPAVKGMPNLSASKFSDCGPTRKFTGETLMDRQAMIEALKAAGYPVESLTETVPDEVVKATLDFVQKCNANPAPPPTPPVTMTDITPVPDDPNDPTKKGLMQFSDRFGKRRVGTLAEANAEQVHVLNRIAANNAAVLRQQETILADAKKGKVKLFRDEMTGLGGRSHAYMTPAQFDAIEPMLLAADDVAVRKFSDGKTDGSELAEHIARIRAAHRTPVKKFGDQHSDPHRPGGGPADARPEIVQQILKGTPEGRAVLAAQAAAKK